MWLIYIFLMSLMTSILGALKNFVKYKQFNMAIFFRTPIICVLIGIFLFHFHFDLHCTFFVIILERWFMLIYKTVIAYVNGNYMKKKDKYIIKYGMKYSINE
jgi:hypothetical protein